MSYVKFKVSDDLKKEILRTLESIADTRDSKIRIGMNETTKSIERKNAKLVVMAEDVSPPEILFHVPMICEEKGIAYGYVSKKANLGRAVNISVGTSAIAVERVGSGNEKLLGELLKKIEASK